MNHLPIVEVKLEWNRFFRDDSSMLRRSLARFIIFRHFIFCQLDNVSDTNNLLCGFLYLYHECYESFSQVFVVCLSGAAVRRCSRLGEYREEYC